MVSDQRGRKPRGNYKQKTKVLSTRIRADTRLALEEAARLSEHSLSQEIEYRLRRSFDEDTKIGNLFGSRRNYAILRLISCVMETVHIEQRPDATWIDDPLLFGELLSAIVTILEQLGPPGGVSPAPPLTQTTLGGMPVRGQTFLGELRGYMHASIRLDDVRYATADLPLDRSDPAPFIRSDLGSLADRIGQRRRVRLTLEPAE